MVLSIINEIIATKNSYIININFGLTFNFEVLSFFLFIAFYHHSKSILNDLNVILN